jgi:hypothetical protein
MPIIGIDHVQLAMPPGQEERARAFYRDVLGLPETPKPPDLAKRGGCWFETDRVKVHLGIDNSFHPASKAIRVCWSATCKKSSSAAEKEALQLSMSRPSKVISAASSTILLRIVSNSCRKYSARISPGQ